MQFNDAGMSLIKNFEGCVLTAYPDPGTGGEPYTIGYGHTGHVLPNMKISQAIAETLLESDIQKTVEGVQAILHPTLTDNQFSAVVCFAFNVGLGNLKNSSLLKFLNAGNTGLAANEFLKWDKAAGKVLPGLVKRRAAEQALFLKV